MENSSNPASAGRRKRYPVRSSHRARRGRWRNPRRPARLLGSTRTTPAIARPWRSLGAGTLLPGRPLHLGVELRGRLVQGRLHVLAELHVLDAGRHRVVVPLVDDGLRTGDRVLLQALDEGRPGSLAEPGERRPRRLAGRHVARFVNPGLRTVDAGEPLDDFPGQLMILPGSGD